jgi:hypothetical protein
VELGYVDLGNYFAYDKNAAANLDWFYHLTGGVTHTDFFAIRPTDYSKAAKMKTMKTSGDIKCSLCDKTFPNGAPYRKHWEEVHLDYALKHTKQIEKQLYER